jgi:Na+/proline symporter
MATSWSARPACPWPSPPHSRVSPGLMLAVVLAYFALLLAVARWSSRGADDDAFYIGNRSSHWALVAFGMIGTSLSGVTFVSVPGAVGHDGFGYFQLMLGLFAGYFVIAAVLLPLYYRHRVTTIYDYLDARLGAGAHRTGAALFVVSRTLGATARLYLVVNILHAAFLEQMGIPFWLTSTLVVALIVAYTFQGGVKTIVWTDTLQTSCMLAGLVVIAATVLSALDITIAQALGEMGERGLSTIFTTDVHERGFFAKQFVAGAFIAIGMTGLDQEMMQKTISVRTLRDSQKNIVAMALVMLGVVLLFLFLGGLLHLYAPVAGVDARGDALLPAIVFGHMAPAIQLVFLVALVSALRPSADGAITALTSSTCLDLLGLRRRAIDEATRVRLRHRVHLAFAAVFLLLLLAFKAVASASMIGVILTLAAYTYGPLLGLFAFAILCRRPLRHRWVPVVAIAAPLLCFWIDRNQRALFGSYEVGLELLVLNGALTFAGLWLISKRQGTASG